MAIHTIKKDRTTEIDITAGNETWVLAQGVTVETADTYGINIDYDADNTKLRIAGTVNLLDGGGTAVYVAADNSSVTIQSTGVVRSAAGGVDLTADGATLANHGKIIVNALSEVGVFANGKTNAIENDGLIRSVDDNAVEFGSGEQSLENNGTISGRSGVFGYSLMSQSVIRNHEDGRIIGAQYGVRSHNDSLIVNDGLIRVTDGPFAVQLGSNSDRLVNGGQIDGAVDMGSGDDRYVGKAGGMLDGNLGMGAGDDVLDLRHGSASKASVLSGDADNDTYLVASTGLNILEGMGGGTDAVKSSVSFTLGDNFENLYLVGSADINGKGNAGDNYLEGNAGDNRLAGRGGSDALFGGKGTDYLTGGADLDGFYFRADAGKEIVTDFVDGVDRLVLFGPQGMSGADFVEEYGHNSHGDLVLSWGGTQMILEGIQKSQITDADFIS